MLLAWETSAYVLPNYCTGNRIGVFLTFHPTLPELVSVLDSTFANGACHGTNVPGISDLQLYTLHARQVTLAIDILSLGLSTKTYTDVI